MKILKFNQFLQIFEKISPVTTNWFIISDEGSFDRKEEGGYFIFNQKGIFSISYQKKDKKGESRLDFYNSKESSPDKKTICECKIIKDNGETESSKKFIDINLNNIWEIIWTFFDYSDLEIQEKISIDKFLMGFSKSLKDIKAHGSSETLPSSFNRFNNILLEESKNKKDFKFTNEKDHKIIEIIKEFIKYLNKLN